MLKYKDVAVTFSEIPEEVTLCINITGCPIKCPECHSKYLWENIGEELTIEAIDTFLKENSGITAVCLMGGDANPTEVWNIAKHIKKVSKLKVGWYSGNSFISDTPLEYFDYIKTGPYKQELGGLDSITTNQRFYKVVPKYAFNNNSILYRYLEDITYKFQKA